MATLAAWPALQCPAAIAPVESARFYEDAVQHFNRGEHEAAIVELKNAVQANPDNIAARILLGRAYLEAAQPAAAEKELLAARARGADDSLVAVPLADAYLMQRRFDELLASMPTAGYPLAIESELLLRRGRAHLELRQLDEAEAAFAEALRVRPRFAPALMGRAAVARHQGDLAAAGELLSQVEAIAPEAPELWLQRAELARSRGASDEALAHYARAIERAPRHVEALKGRATILLQRGRHEAALEDLEIVREEVPFEPFAAYLHALALREANDVEGARRALETAVVVLESMDPAVLDSHGPSLLLAGIINVLRGNIERAFPYLSRYVARFPRHPGSRKYLGYVLLERGQPLRAIRTLEPAVEMVPDSAELLTLLGTAYLRNDEHEQAARMFERATALDPEQAASRLQLAHTRLAAGDPEQAIGAFEALLDMAPGLLDAGLPLATLLMKRGEFEQALPVAERLAQANPDNLTARTLVGAAQVGLGRNKAARVTFERLLEQAPDFLPARFNLATLDAREGDLDSAAAGYRAILETHPAETRAMLELSRIAEAQGRVADAIEWLEKLRAHEAGATREILHLVELYLARGDTERAREVVLALEQQHPEDLHVLEAIGRVELAAGRRDHAVMRFRRMPKLAGFQSGWLRRIARNQLAAEDLAGARWSLTKATQADPDDVQALAALSALELQAGQPETAREHAERARELRPESGLGEELLGDVHMAVGRHAAAMAAYERAAQQRPAAEVIIKLYRARLQAGEPGALATLERWARAHPGDRRLQHALAEARIQAGELRAAAEQYEQLLASDGEDPDAHNNLALLALALGEPARALEHAQAAFALRPQRADIIDTLGWVLVRSGEPQRGLNYLRDAHARAARNREIRYHIAVALDALGRTAEARAELEAILGEEAGFHGADEARGLLARLREGG